MDSLPPEIPALILGAVGTVYGMRWLWHNTATPSRDTFSEDHPGRTRIGYAENWNWPER